MKKNILILLSLCLVIFSCQKDEEPMLSVNQTEIAVTNEGGLQIVSFESNMSWTAKSSESWCSIYPSSGDASTNSTTITAAINDSFDDRSCTVTIAVEGLSKIVTINQSANSGLIVTQNKYELSNDASTIEVEVKANVEFEVNTSDKWITRVTPRSLSSSKISFDITKNESYDNREGSITIKQKNGSLTSTVKIFQSQEDAIILSKKTEYVSSEGQTLELELKTNVDVEVIIPEAAKSWVSHTVTRSLRTETLLLSIAENKDYDERTTEVYITNKSTSLQDTLAINQGANLGLLVTQDKYDLSNETASIEVEVKANVEFDVMISDNWITRISTRALSSTKLNFNIAKNESYDNREGSITIKQKNGSLTSTIKIYQSQEDAIILSNIIENLSSETQTLQVELKTNVDVEIIIPVVARSWVSYTPTRSLRTETLLLNIAANETSEFRTTEIYIKNIKTNLHNTLTIHQRVNIKPLLKSPANYKTETNRLPTFRWSEVKNTQGHQFWYKFEYSDNMTTWKFSYNVYDTAFNLLSYLAPYKQYYWRVAAISFSDGSVYYSDIYTFTTGTKTSYFDGEYKIAQSHTIGANPSKILFLGDGYISEDFEEGGQFDRDMDEGIEAFFAVEPYSSYREYFTVYKQAGYSRDRGVMQTDKNIFKESKFGANFSGSTIVSANNNKVFEYAVKIPGIDYEKLRNILIVLVINENRYAGTCYTWSDGKAIAIAPVSRSTYSNTHFSNIINHEAGGHGFGRLADEYVSVSNIGKSITELEKNRLMSRFGNNPNVDLTNDLTQIKWKHMIGLANYYRVNAFEGGYYFSYGVWKPEVSSCMINNQKYYNAPSREAIVERIYNTAELQYTFEAFMEKDIEKSPSKSVVMQTRSVNPLTFVPLAPPVMVE